MIIVVTTVACFVCGLIGYFVGWVTTVDRQDRRAEPAHAEPGSVVTARESDEFWEGVYGGSHARTSPRVTAGGGFPALPAAGGAMRIGNMTDPVALALAGQQPPLREGWQAGDRIPSWGDRPLNATEAAALNLRTVEQPPLRELVHAGRTTDVIEKMRADTDRWLAARGLDAG